MAHPQYLTDCDDSSFCLVREGSILYKNHSQLEIGTRISFVCPEDDSAPKQIFKGKIFAISSEFTAMIFRIRYTFFLEAHS